MATQAEVDAINAALSEARKSVEAKKAVVEALRGWLKEAESKLADADNKLHNLLDRQFDMKLGKR